MTMVGWVDVMVLKESVFVAPLTLIQCIWGDDVS